MPSLLVFPEAAFFGGRGIFFGARQYGQGGWLGVTPDNNAWFYAKALVESFGWPAVAVGLAGLAGLKAGARRPVLWMLPFPAGYLALLIAMSMVVKRNLYPVVPILAALLLALPFVLPLVYVMMKRLSTALAPSWRPKLASPAFTSTGTLQRPSAFFTRRTP